MLFAVDWSLRKAPSEQAMPFTLCSSLAVYSRTGSFSIQVLDIILIYMLSGVRNLLTGHRSNMARGWGEAHAVKVSLDHLCTVSI